MHVSSLAEYLVYGLRVETTGMETPGLDTVDALLLFAIGYLCT